MRVTFNSYISKIRDIESIETGGETPINKSQILSIREKELYIDGKTLKFFTLSNLKW